MLIKVMKICEMFYIIIVPSKGVAKFSSLLSEGVCHWKWVCRSFHSWS